MVIPSVAPTRRISPIASKAFAITSSDAQRQTSRYVPSSRRYSRVSTRSNPAARHWPMSSARWARNLSTCSGASVNRCVRTVAVRSPREVHSIVVWACRVALLRPQLTAFFTSAAIRFSSAGVSFVRNQPVGHMVPSSRLAAWSNPNVAYRSLYFEAALKKQMTLPSLA